MSNNSWKKPFIKVQKFWFPPTRASLFNGKKQSQINQTFVRTNFLVIKIFANSQLSAMNFKILSPSLEQFLLTKALCAFFSILFHGQIVQIAFLQVRDPENKKCSHWKVFGISHPQNLRLLSRRGPRSLDLGLSQHYIGSKMTFFHFSNFYRKKFPSLSKRLKHIFIQLWGLQVANIM